jgi:hypothetical protein
VEWETRRAEADAARLAAAAQVQRARLEADAAVEVARAEAAKAAAEARLAKLGLAGPRRLEPRSAGSGRTGSRLAPVGDIERRMHAHWHTERAAGRPPTGAELDRIAGTKDYGRKLRRQLLTEQASTEASHTGHGNRSIRFHVGFSNLEQASNCV